MFNSQKPEFDKEKQTVATPKCQEPQSEQILILKKEDLEEINLNGMRALQNPELSMKNRTMLLIGMIRTPFSATEEPK